MVLLAALAVAAVLAVSVAVARLRRSGRGPAITLAPPSRRAGVSQLATRVSELSDLGVHLRPGPPQRRLGTLLGSGSAASR